MIEKRSILIIIPAYNEGATIGRVLSKIKRHGYSNIVVVDDGSTDETAQIARNKKVKVISHILNRGPGAATQTGMEYARTIGVDCVVTIDADEQHDPEDIDVLVDGIFLKGINLAIGNRFMKGTNNIPRIRVIFNGIANLITYFFSGKWISDTQSGLKAMDAEALQVINVDRDGFEFCSEMVIKANRLGLQIKEFPVSVYYTNESRRKGQNLFTGIKTLGGLLQSFMFRN